MYNWSDYISEANIEAFKAEYGVTKFQYDIYANNEELLAKLQGGASGYDIACADRRVRARRWSRRASSRSSTSSRIPNFANINPTVQEPVVGPEQRVPGPQGLRDDRRPVPLDDRSPTVPTSWQEFYDLVKGTASGKTVFVDSMGDVFVFPLKMLGYSLNSTIQKELDEARDDPARRRPAPPRARLGHVRRQDGQRRGGPDPRLDRAARPGA